MSFQPVGDRILGLGIQERSHPLTLITLFVRVTVSKSALSFACAVSDRVSVSILRRVIGTKFRESVSEAPQKEEHIPGSPLLTSDVLARVQISY